MKLQLDTKLKIIKIEEKVNLGDLFSKLEEMFPDATWREYTLETGTIINWISPITIYPHYPYTPDYPSPNYPWITYIGDTSQEVQGVYNINIT